MDRERQGAYLRAMGIVPWRPAMQPEPGAADVSVITEPVTGSEPESAGENMPERAASSVPVSGDAPDIGAMDWAGLQQLVSVCTRCALSEGRTQTVFGTGDRQARVMVVGEAPGAEEDRRGEPFVGRAGGLLDNMLLAMGQPRPKVFIANIVKCRPAGNRDPSDAEAAACASYLNRQIELVAPEVILAVGRVAARSLLARDEKLGALRGRLHEFSLPGSDAVVPVVVTYHPAYLLRSPDRKGLAWQDLKLVRAALGEAS